MTVEQAREYWSYRLVRAEDYSDENWDAEERHAHADYVDAMKAAVAALVYYREAVENKYAPENKHVFTNGDKLRKMTDEELAKSSVLNCTACNSCSESAMCADGHLAWLKQEVTK